MPWKLSCKFLASSCKTFLQEFFYDLVRLAEFLSPGCLVLNFAISQTWLCLRSFICNYVDTTANLPHVLETTSGELLFIRFIEIFNSKLLLNLFFLRKIAKKQLFLPNSAAENALKVPKMKIPSHNLIFNEMELSIQEARVRFPEGPLNIFGRIHPENSCFTPDGKKLGLS